MSKKWKVPDIKEVTVKEDSTSGDCHGKMIGCHAGSSCGSVEIRDRDQIRKKKQK